MNSKGKCFESNRLWGIGVIGFEPTASCSQSRRSSQAELHPDKVGVAAGCCRPIVCKRAYHSQQRALYTKLADIANNNEHDAKAGFCPFVTCDSRR